MSHFSPLAAVQSFDLDFYAIFILVAWFIWQPLDPPLLRRVSLNAVFHNYGTAGSIHDPNIPKYAFFSVFVGKFFTLFNFNCVTHTENRGWLLVADVFITIIKDTARVGHARPTKNLWFRLESIIFYGIAIWTITTSSSCTSAWSKSCLNHQIHLLTSANQSKSQKE